MATLQTSLRDWRLRAGLTQQTLGERAGVSRQTIGGIEAGLYGPGVEVGLRLARALGCRIEDLFALAPEPVAAVAGGATPTAGPARVALGTVGGRAIARPLSGLGALRWRTAAAHGLVRGAPSKGMWKVERFPGAQPALFLAGCDPALGLLAAHFRRASGSTEALWWQAGNAAAAQQLRRGEVHAAGIHGPSEAGQRPSGTPAGGDLAAFRVAAWQMGWMVRPGNPAAIHGAADLARPGVRLGNREPGAGARILLDRLLTAAGIAPAAVAGYDHAYRGHAEVADAVALGVCDAGIGLGVAAAERGLAFIPLDTEVCDLWVPAELLGDPAVAALIEALASGTFRADLAAFGPYDTSETGDRVA